MTQPERTGTTLDRGATAVEYALLVALIAGVVIFGVIALGPVVDSLYQLASANW